MGSGNVGKYNTQAELITNAMEYRKGIFRSTIIVQDWYYWPKGEKEPGWNRAKYPDPKTMLEKLKELRYKTDGLCLAGGPKFPSRKV